jgi:hypothetical protein
MYGRKVAESVSGRCQHEHSKKHLGDSSCIPARTLVRIWQSPDYPISSLGHFSRIVLHRAGKMAQERSRMVSRYSELGLRWGGGFRETCRKLETGIRKLQVRTVRVRDHTAA